MMSPRDHLVSLRRLPPRRLTRAAIVSALEQQLVARIEAGGSIAEPRLDRPSIPGYALGERIGEGAMGEVWAATAAHDRPVALKVMRRSFALDPESRRRFLREGRAIASLAHPGIVDVIEVGLSTDGRPFIAMERLEGTTLREHLRRHGALDWEQVRSIVGQLASALGAAHERGIVHRDVKPSNVMLEIVAGAPRCTVIDFGLARRHGLGRSSTPLTQIGQVLGTPSYISPEALRGEATDGRSDVYALGCVAYELLEGRRPFEGEGLEELLLQHLGRPVPRPTLTTVPEPLIEQVWAILRRALCKRPEHRFPTMAALARAVEAVRVGGTPVAVPHEVLRGVASDDAEVTVEEDATPRSWPWTLVLVFGLIGGLWTAMGGTGGRVSVEPPARGDAELESGVGADVVETAGPAAPVRVAALATGVALTCALSEHGVVRCWGSDSFGRLGRGSDGSHVGDNELPVDVPPLALPADRRAVDLVSSADARHVCIVWDDRRARCWGYNTTDQLGLGTFEDWGDQAHETVAALADLPFEGIEQIATGAKITCVRLEGGEGRCWGYGGDGLRGDGSTQVLDGDRPLASSSIAVGPEPIRQLALGLHHGCALLGNGEVRCWGSNAQGQLGVPGWRHSIGDGVGNGLGLGERPDDSRLAVHGLADVEVRSVHAAAERTCVLTSEHGVRCWGRDAHGTLGYSTELDLDCAATSEPGECDLEAPPPFDLDLGARIIWLSLGLEHSCAVDDEGGVRCWGHTSWGQLGDGEIPRSRDEHGRLELLPRLPREQVVDLGDADLDGRVDPAVRVHAGNVHACALMQDGGIRCWGRGAAGRLGYGSADNVGDNETPAEYYARRGYLRVPVF